MEPDKQFCPPNHGIGLLIYDGSCGMCIAAVVNNRPFFERHGVTIVPLQTPGLVEWSGIDETALMTEIHLRLPDGQWRRGVDALIEIGKHIWWLKPFALLATLRPITPIAAWGYRLIARHRQILSGACGLHGPTTPRQIDADTVSKQPSHRWIKRP